MNQLIPIVKSLKSEIRKHGSVRKKLSILMAEWFEKSQKNRGILKKFDQLLFEEEIIAYTRHNNIRDGKEGWDWYDLRGNNVFITFVQNKKSIRQQSLLIID